MLSSPHLWGIQQQQGRIVELTAPSWSELKRLAAAHAALRASPLSI